MFFGHALDPGFFAGVGVGFEFGLGHFAHEPGLADGEDVLDGAVEGECGGEVVAEEEENEREIKEQES